MQIEFSELQEYRPEWRDNRNLPPEDQIVTKLKVMDIGTLMNILDAFSKVGLQGQVDTEVIESSKMKPILAEFGQVLPNHVVEFDGLTTKKGDKVTVEEVVKYPVYMNLAIELLMKIVEISSPSEEDSKN